MSDQRTSVSRAVERQRRQLAAALSELPAVDELGRIQTIVWVQR